MKDFKIILAALALGFSILIIGVFTIAVFNYISFLKEQNYALMDVMNHNIFQLQKSIGAIESEALMQQLVDLKAENLELKKENDRLGALVERLGGKKRARKTQEPAAVKEETRKQSGGGNRGFLFRRSQERQ